MAAYTNYGRDPRVRREAEALVDAGFRVVFLASRYPEQPNRETIAGVEVIKAPRLNTGRTSAVAYMIDYALFALVMMAHLVVHPRKYRLIHVNNMPDFLVFAAWLPRLLGRPVIHDVHDLMPELFCEKFRSGERHWLVRVLKLQERMAGRFATAVLTVEDRLADILSQRGIPRAKIRVLMNLPDDRIFAPRTKSPALDGPFVVVYHGTLARRLGLDIAVEAVARIKSDIPRLRLRIIGAGEERENLIQLSERLGVKHLVEFSDGFVSVEAIPKMIEDANVGLIPLRISSGTDIMLPTKLLEYVTVGIPCIVPKTRTISRYFDAEMVRFFEAENVDSLAEAILDLYRRPEQCESLARRATERFGRSHTWSAHKQVYVGLVRELSKGAPRRNVRERGSASSD
jgi:glycosyltransferase involved in cell wall biosynthesis